MCLQSFINLMLSLPTSGDSAHSTLVWLLVDYLGKVVSFAVCANAANRDVAILGINCDLSANC
jgi:hypothetical protein